MKMKLIRIWFRNKDIVLGYFIIAAILSIFVSVYLKINVLIVLKGFFLAFLALYLPGTIIYNTFENELDMLENIAMSIGISIVLSVSTLLIANTVFKIKITVLSSILLTIFLCFVTLCISFVYAVGKKR